MPPLQVIKINDNMCVLLPEIKNFKRSEFKGSRVNLLGYIKKDIKTVFYFEGSKFELPIVSCNYWSHKLTFLVYGIFWRTGKNRYKKTEAKNVLQQMTVTLLLPLLIHFMLGASGPRSMRRCRTLERSYPCCSIWVHKACLENVYQSYIWFIDYCN